MEKTDAEYSLYLQIMHEELLPALGCTEPIAIAYAAAKAAEALGREPERLVAACSGNIIKNVKGVIVPGTDDLRGIKASALLGAFAGDASKQLEVLSSVTPDDVARCRALLAQDICQEEHLHSASPLHIVIRAYVGGDSVEVELKDAHTNIVRISRNGETIFSHSGCPAPGDDTAQLTDRSCLSVQKICDFAASCDTRDVAEVLQRQIDYNLRIAEEGLRHQYGANVGATLLKVFGTENLDNLAKAYAAAGSDARMSGCVLPVIINSGSGNQGITASLPVIVYARYLHKTQEELYRALVISNLIAIHQKTRIGRLSAYCGVVSAACGSGAAITYLSGGSYEQICKTITNTLANVSGIVCDGAKPSCAAKIASSLDAALMAHHMAMNEKTFGAGEGLVKEDVERTIQSVGQLASKGMLAADAEILKIMIEKD